MKSNGLNKNGRNKVAQSKKRKANKILLYLNDEEMVRFNKMFTGSSHKERSPFIREVLLEGKYEITYRDKTREEQIYALAKVGTNINQIAHRLNMDNVPRLTERDHAVFAEFKELFLNIEF